jgi:hypothetical protein
VTGPVAVDRAAGAPEEARRRPPWYRRRWFLVTAAVTVVVAIAVITDLPTSTSPAADAQAEATVIGQINAGVGPCVYAVREAQLIYAKERAGTLTAGERSQVPALLRDDQNACSLTNESVFNLSDIDVVGTPAGKRIGQAVSTSTTWVTSDALGVVDLIEILSTHPHDRRALAHLAVDRRNMTTDRDRVDADVAAASALVDHALPRIKLISGSQPSGLRG